MNYKSKSSMIGWIITAVLVPFSYIFLNELYLTIFPYFYNMTGGNADIFMDKHYYFVDTIFCIIVMFLYVPLWVKSRNINPLSYVDRSNEYSISIKQSINQIEEREDIGFKGVLNLIIITLGFNGFSFLWLEFADRYLKVFPIFNKSIHNFNEAWSSTGDDHYVFVLLSVVILGPVVEELMFRGIVYNVVSGISQGFLPVIVSALAFGIWHGEPVQIVYTAVLGFGIALVYKGTHNFGACIFIHVLNNFLGELPPPIAYDSVYSVLNIIAVVMLPLAIFITVRINIEGYSLDNCFKRQKTIYFKE